MENDTCLPPDIDSINPLALEILNDPDLIGVYDERELMRFIIEEELAPFSVTDVSFSRSHLLSITLNHR